MAQLVCGDGMTVGAAWLQFADRYSVLVASILGVVPSRQPWLFGATAGRPCIGLGAGSAGSRAS